MIKINLLSPSDRLSAKWEKTNRLIVSNFLILIIGQFVLMFIFLASIKYLDIENSGSNKQLEHMQTQSEIREVEEIKTVIGEYDKQSRIILELQEDRFSFTEILGNFSEIIPIGIKINSIDIKPKVNKIVNKTKRDNNEKENAINTNKFDFNIIGIAKNRESLLKLENNLRDSKVFADLIIDLSNYNNENNNFRYSMTIEMN